MAWHPETERWQSSLGCFVREYGLQHGSTRLAAELEVTPGAIYHWVAGRFHPRPDIAKRLVAIAGEFGARLTLDDVYGSVNGQEGNWVTEWAASR